MKDVPFKYVFIHGLVRDSQGRKMSKSLGNGIDPLDVIANYGTDALRFALTLGVSPGNDLRYLPEKVESARNFANKIWNATRFVQMNLDEDLDLSKVDESKFNLADKWILSRLNNLISEVTENLNKFELGLALQKVYDFVWDEFCDWYIETVKPRLFDKESESRTEAAFVLNKVLVDSMKLLHPFMPFVTEEIYQNLEKDADSIMISKWPAYNEKYSFPEAEEQMLLIIDAIRSIRNLRAEMNVPHSRKAKTIFVTDDEIGGIIKEGEVYFKRLASASDVTVTSAKPENADKSATCVIAGVEIFMPLEDLIDINKEIERLEAELAHLTKELDRVNSKLSNQAFVTKAPQKLVEEERAKKEKYADMYQKVEQRLNSLKNADK